ncbi:MAG: hypothetical protein JWR12_2027 [Mucilaginibacter sp.]|nr:hypothetical protein [Mucilaginibacter sp.]
MEEAPNGALNFSVFLFYKQEAPPEPNKLFCKINLTPLESPVYRNDTICPINGSIGASLN